MKTRVVVGLHAVREALRQNANRVTELWILQGTERRQDMGELRQLALRKNSGIKIQFRSENELRQWSPSHQGVLAKLVGAPVCDWEQLLAKESFCVLVLDHLEDPQNLGSILRTCWGVGVDCVLIPPDRQAGLTPTVHKVASGGVEHVPVLQEALVPRLQQLKEAGAWVFGFAADAKQSFFQLQIPSKRVYVFGSESSGLKGATRKLCDEFLSLPQLSSFESYNVSVSVGAVLLYDFSVQEKS